MDSNRTKVLRPRLGISPKELRMRLGISRAHVHRVMSGQYPPTPKLALRIYVLSGKKLGLIESLSQKEINVLLKAFGINEDGQHSGNKECAQGRGGTP